jgi:hypothetical protein
MASRWPIAIVAATSLALIVGALARHDTLLAQDTTSDTFQQQAAADAAWVKQFAAQDQLDAEAQAVTDTVDVLADESVLDTLEPNTPQLDAVAPAAVPSRVRGFNTAQLLDWIDSHGVPAPELVPCPSPTNADPGATTPRTRLDCALTLMAAGGSAIHRLIVFWADVQPDDNAHFHWEKYDTLLSAATAHHITKVILAPVGSPNWARICRPAPGPCRRTDPMGPFSKYAHPDSNHLAGWRNFVAALAARYPATGYEIGNEENTNNFWDATPTNEPPSPTAYAQLFCNASRAIHGVRSTARVGIGGLAAVFSTNLAGGSGDKKYRSNTFVERSFDAGVGDGGCRVDFVAYHPYETNAYCTTTPADIGKTATMAELRHVHARMIGAGHPNLKVWITEWGFPSRNYGKCTKYSPTRQANLIRIEHNYLARQTFTAFSGYFNLVDDDTPTVNGSIGMVCSSWSPKPSYNVWRQLAPPASSPAPTTSATCAMGEL